MYLQRVVAQAPSRAPARSRAGVILAIAAASMTGHILGWSYVGYDVGRWLLPWYDHILVQGRIGAFATPFSNYTPPYLYLMSAASLLDGLLSPLAAIKLLSVAGTGALAAATYHLLGTLGIERRGEKAALVFLLPTTLLNAPVLAQCDAMWAAAAIMVVAEAVRRRAAPLLLWSGVAVALKLQAAFIAPFVLAWLLAEKVPLRLWVIPPAVYAAAMAPAWLLGWPAVDLATVYFRQAQYFNTIGNASNPWIFAGLFPAQTVVAFAWVGFAAAMLAVAAYIRTFASRHIGPRDILLAALLSSILLPFFLPKMHERYFFLADILALSYAWAVRDRHSILLAIAVQAASVLALLGYFLDTAALPMIGCLLMILVLAGTVARLTPLRDGPAAEPTPRLSAA